MVDHDVRVCRRRLLEGIGRRNYVLRHGNRFSVSELGIRREARGFLNWEKESSVDFRD